MNQTNTSYEKLNSHKISEKEKRMRKVIVVGGSFGGVRIVVIVRRRRRGIMKRSKELHGEAGRRGVMLHNERISLGSRPKRGIIPVNKNIDAQAGRREG